MDKKPAIRFACLLSASVDSTNLQNDIVASVLDCGSAFLRAGRTYRLFVCFNIHPTFHLSVRSSVRPSTTPVTYTVNFIV